MFRRFYPKVHRFVAMLLKNEDDADDVCQLIFLKVWHKREKFADIKDFDSYLFILASNPQLSPSTSLLRAHVLSLLNYQIN